MEAYLYTSSICLEDFKKCAENFTFANLVTLGNHITEQYCYDNINTFLRLFQYTRYTLLLLLLLLLLYFVINSESTGVDWLSLLIATRDGILAWNDQVYLNWFILKIIYCFRLKKRH